MDANAEINRLRSTLIMTGQHISEVDAVVDQAALEINSIILDAVSAATGKAIDFAMEIGATQFIDEVDVQDVGGAFQIRTISGKTDFSEPPFPMLPKLLKNAKTSKKDGSRYKVIPIKKKTEERARVQLTSAFEVQQQIQRQIKAARSAISDKKTGRMASSNVMGNNFSSMMEQLRAESNRMKHQPKSTYSGQPEYRTASSKQDPTTKWVRPAKEMNMTGFLMNLNTQLSEQISQSVGEIVQKYGGKHATSTSTTSTSKDYRFRNK